MAIKQTEAAKRRETPPTGYVAGAVMVAIFVKEFVTDGYTTGTDKVEFGTLPAFARPIRVRFLPEGVGTPNLTAGLLSGEPGVPDDARTLGTEFASAAALTNNTTLNATDLAVLAVTPSDKHRAIGASLSASVVAGAGKKLTCVVEYVY